MEIFNNLGSGPGPRTPDESSTVVVSAAVACRDGQRRPQDTPNRRLGRGAIVPGGWGGGQGELNLGGKQRYGEPGTVPPPPAPGPRCLCFPPRFSSPCPPPQPQGTIAPRPSLKGPPPPAPGPLYTFIILHSCVLELGPLYSLAQLCSRARTSLLSCTAVF